MLDSNSNLQDFDVQPIDIYLEKPNFQVEMISYVYIYLDPRNPGKYHYGDLEYSFLYEPFYVGKGQGCRWRVHLDESKKWLNKKIDSNKCNGMKIGIIHKIWVTGKEVLIVKIAINLTDKEAKELEIKLIKTIGRRDKGLGPLTNMTDGGDGWAGNQHTEKTCQEIRKARKDKTYDEIYGYRAEEVKEKIRKSNTGKKASKETREKIRKNHRGMEGKKHSPKTIHQMKGVREGKTLEDLFGEEKAEIWKKNLSDSHMGQISLKKDKTYDEIYGPDRAEELRKQNSRTYEEKYGIESAKKLRKKLSDSHLGQIQKNTGKIVIYNSELNILIWINSADPIPPGFIRGRRPKSK